MADIFLSHSSADRDAAARIKSWLERDRDGWSVFLDTQPMGGIEAGQGWQNRLRNELQRSRVVLAVITADWLASRWCFAEAVTATFQGKDFFGVLPVDLSDDQLRVAPPIVHERQRQRMDLATGAGWEELLHALDQSGLDPNEWFAIPKGVGPYPGFVAFEERDAGVFFGRDSEITEYLDALNLLRAPDRAQALVISGGSGSGKSSLLKAGLIPRLRRQPNWFIVPPFDPSREPIHALFASLRAAAGSAGVEIDLGDASSPSVDDLHRRLQDALRAIEEKVNAWLLLPLDQAEVLIAGSQGDGNTDASHLLAAIGRLLASRTRKLVAVLTIRTEFLPALERTLPAGVRLQNRSLRPIAALSEIIEKPAARFGIRLDDGLTGRMVEETRGADALPLLAYTLRELYEKYGEDGLSVAEYEKLGGVEGAIERKLTEALSDPSPTPEELAAFRRCFVRHLVRVDENAVEGERYLRTAARRDSLPHEADRLIGRLQNARLLIAGEDGTISIAHERLIRNWSNVPLQAWLAEDAHDRKLIDSLKSFLAAYKDGGPLLSQKPLADGRDFLQREPSLEGDEPELAKFIRASLAAEEGRARRQRRLLIGAAAAAIIFLIVAVVAVWAFLEAQRQTTAAEFATRAADGARISALAQLPDHATEALVSAIRLVAPIVQSGNSLPPQALRGLTDAIAAVGFSVPENHALTGHKGNVESVAISPDGRRILTSGEDKTVRLWDAGTLKLLQTYERRDAFRMPGVASSSFSRDGTRAVLAVRNGAVVVDAANGEIQKEVNGDEQQTFFAGFSSDGTRIITTGMGWIQLWDAATGDRLERFDDQGAVLFAALSPDSKMLAYGGQRQVLVLRNLEGGEPIEQPMNGWVVSGAFAPAGGHLLVATEHGSLLWNVPGKAIIRQGPRLQRIDDHTFSDHRVSMGSEVLDTGSRLDLLTKLPRTSGNDIMFSALSRDGTQVLTLVTADNAARVWNAANGKLLAILEGHTASVLSAAFTPDGRRVVTASEDGTARVWDLRPDLSLDSVTTGTSTIKVVAVSPDGQRVVSVSEGGGAVVWTPGRGGVVKLDGEVTRWSPPAFSADGRRVLAIGEDRVPRMWDADRGATLAEYRGHDGAVRTAVLSPDGTLVVTGGEDQTVRLWDAATGAQRHLLKGHTARLGTVQFSPDGQRIVSSGAGAGDKDDPRALVWSANGAQQTQLEGTVEELEAGAFSRDGTMIVGEGEGGKATVWNAQSGAILAAFDATRILGIHGSFSPDGSRIITTDDDGLVRLWDTRRSGSDPLATFRADSGEAAEARLSPDGSRLISYGGGQSLHLWNVTSSEPLVIFAGQSNSEGEVAFMPDGLRFVAASGSRLNVYPVTVEQFLVRGCSMLRHRGAFKQVADLCPATAGGK